MKLKVGEDSLDVVEDLNQCFKWVSGTDEFSFLAILPPEE